MGGFAEVKKLLARNSVQLRTEAIHLLFLLCVPEASFAKCWGGSRIMATVESFSTVRVGLKQETEFIIDVSAYGLKTRIRKKLSAVTAFHEAMVDALQGAVDLPLPSSQKGKVDAAEVTKVLFTVMFEVLSMPENFSKMTFVDRARKHLLEFLEIDPRPLLITHAVLEQLTGEFMRHYRLYRNLPLPILQLLVQLMTGDVPFINTQIVTEFPELSADFSITKITEPWTLPIVLQAVTTAPSNLAVTVLEELSDFLSNAPNLGVLNSDKFYLWFLPVLFDRYASPDSTNDDDRPLDLFLLGVNILCVLISQHIVYTSKDDGASEPSDSLFASAIIYLGSENDREKLPYPQRNMHIVHAIENGVVHKLLGLFSTFVDNYEHRAWDNIFGIFNVFRNLVWCPVEQPLAADVHKHLLSKPGQSRIPETALMLVPDQTLGMIRTLLQQMNFFVAEVVHEQFASALDNRIKNIKGTGIAYMGFFRDCIACIRSVESEDVIRALSLLISTYVFDVTYTQDEEERLKLVEIAEIRKRAVGPSLESGKLLERQHAIDLDVLSAGVTVWRIGATRKDTKLCYLFLKKQVSLQGTKDEDQSAERFAVVIESGGKKLFVQTLFEQATLEVTCDAKLLAKLGMSAVQHMGMTLWNKKQRSCLVCVSADDFEIWGRALRILHERHLFKGSASLMSVASESSLPLDVDILDEPRQLEGDSFNLHKLITLVYRFYNNPLSKAMMEYSDKVQSATKGLSPEFGDLNRLRFLVKNFQAKSSCKSYVNPCDKCGKSQKAHSMKKQHKGACQGVLQDTPSGGGVCASCQAKIPAGTIMSACKECTFACCQSCYHAKYAQCPGYVLGKGACAQCGRAAAAHPWEEDVVCECKCGTDEPCLLFTIKTFIGYGGVDCLQRLFLAGSPLALVIQKLCFQLLWMICCIPQHAFVRCWGGTLVKVGVFTSGTPANPELLFTVDCFGMNNKIKKKLAAAITFQETLTELLTGVAPKTKGKIVEAEEGKTSLVALFDIVGVLDNFHKMLRIDKARALFLDFLEIDPRPLQVTREGLTQLFTELTKRYSNSRNLPSSIPHFLVPMMCGEAIPAPIDIITTAEAAPKPGTGVNFTVNKVQDSWLLSLLLLSLPLVSEDVTIGFLREFNHLFIRFPEKCACILKMEGFQSWFFPLLFDSYGTSEDASGRSVESFHLSVNILCIFHAHYISSSLRTGPDIRAETMLADTVVQTGSYAGTTDSAIESWSKKNVDVVQAVINGIVGKLIGLVSTFIKDFEHAMWANLFEVLNLYRNMTWIPVVVGSITSRATYNQLIRHLLNRATMISRNLTNEQAITLLNEHSVAMLRNLLHTLKLYNVEVKEKDVDLNEVTRIKIIKGAGLAFTAYFRDCDAQFRSTRNASPEDQVKILAQYFGAYKFDPSYSKEADDRWTAIDTAEANRRRSAAKAQDLDMKDVVEDKKQHARDLEALSAGMTVWKVRVKGNSAKQSYMFLKSEGMVALDEGQDKGSTFERFSLVLEAKGRKHVLTLFEQATLELTVDAKLLLKHGLEYAQHMGMTLWKNKKPHACLVFTSVDDFYCWQRVLKVLQSRRIQAYLAHSLQTSIEVPQLQTAQSVGNLSAMDAASVLALALQYYNGKLNKSLQELGAKGKLPSKNADLKDLSLLRAIACHCQTKTGCEKFCPPCEKCEKAESEHVFRNFEPCLNPSCPGVLQEVKLAKAVANCGNCQSKIAGSAGWCNKCNNNFCQKCQNCSEYAPSSSATGNCASCGKLANAHPFEMNAVSICHCGSKEDCLLFFLKSFICHGGLSLLLQRLADSSPLQLAFQRNCLHLLWLLNSVSSQTFERCLGGTIVRVTVQVPSTSHVGLKPETEFVLIVDYNTKQHKKIKRFSALSPFQETLRELLLDVVDLPKSKNVNVDVEVFKAGLVTMFDLLMVPDNYHKMIRNEKARKLFESFLEIDMKPMQMPREVMTSHFAAFVKTYRAQRNLPSTVIQFLVHLMNGELTQAAEMYKDVPSVPPEPSGNKFVLNKIQDSWILSLIFLALPSAPFDLATGFLRDLNDFFARQPQFRSKMFAEDKFQLWFMPTLFDIDDDDDQKEEKRDRSVILQLAIETLSAAHTHHLLSQPRPLGKKVDLASNVEGLLVATFTLIGGYSNLDLGATPWSKRNMELIQAVANAILGKIVTSVPTFRNKRSVFFRSAWNNIFEVLNIYRNMTWCPIPTHAESTSRHLLSAPAPKSRNLTEEKGFVLLSEHTVAMVRNLLQQLRLFDMDFVQDPNQIKTIKGSGLAFMAYFRDCAACFRTARSHSPEDQIKMIATFYGTYLFNTTYSKEVEDRLKLIFVDTEVKGRSRMTSLLREQGGKVSGKDAAEDAKRFVADLETLAGGITVWRLPPKKNQPQQCYLYLKPHTAENESGATRGDSKYLLVIELKGKKRFLPWLEQVTLATGVDSTLLVKHGLEYAQNMGLTAFIGKETMHFVCTSLDDFECWKRVILALEDQRNREAKEEELGPQDYKDDIAAIDFKTLVSNLRKFYPTTLIRTMLEHSEKVQGANVEVRDLTRIRFHNKLFQAHVGCEKFSVPCQSCGKSPSIHPWQKTSCYNPNCTGTLAETPCKEETACSACRNEIAVGVRMSLCKDCNWGVCLDCVREQGCQVYVPTPNARECHCGKPANSHPWKHMPGSCRCGTEDACVLFTVKSYIAHGAVNSLRKILLAPVGPSPTSLLVHLDGLRLLAFFNTIPSADFLRCWGGTIVSVVVESYNSKAGIFQDTEFTLVASAVWQQTKIRKKLSALSSFQETLTTMLKGVVELPDPPKPKGKTIEAAEATKAGANAMFSVLQEPDNFHKMFRVDKARTLFMEFLEIDMRPLQITRTVLYQIVSGFVRLHRKRRSLPVPFLHLLISMLTGEVRQETLELPSNPAETKVDNEAQFSFSKIEDPWILSLIFLAIPSLADYIAIAFMKRLSELLDTQTQYRSKFLSEEEFQTWFFPVLFDPDASITHEGEASGRTLVFQLAVEILCGIQCQHILLENRSVAPVSRLSTAKPEPAASSAEVIFASTLALIGLHSSAKNEHGQPVIPWSKQNVEILQTVAHGVLLKLMTAIPSFRSKTSPNFRTAWPNLFEVLNVYKNLTWCPEVPATLSREQVQKHWVKQFVGKFTPPTRSLVFDVATELLNPRIVTAIRNLLTHLKVFDFEPDTTHALDSIKGTTHAYMAYFRDCAACFRTIQARSIPGLLALSHLFGTFVFDPSYSKEEEEREKVLEELEMRRRKSVIKAKMRAKQGSISEQDEKKQHQRDLDFLAGGTTVWQVPHKKGGKVIPHYLSMIPSKSAPANTSTKNILSPLTPKKPTFESSWTIVLECARKRTYFKLFEDTTIEVKGIDLKLLPLNALEFAKHMGLCVVHKKTRLDFVCLSAEDFECWDRALSMMNDIYAGRGSGDRTVTKSTDESTTRTVSISGQEFTFFDESDDRRFTIPSARPSD